MTELQTYAVITPARDEAANLPRLADSLARQTVRPDQHGSWVQQANALVCYGITAQQGATLIEGA